MTEQENLPRMYRDDADPEKIESAREQLQAIISREGIAEAMHMEAWLSAVNRITPDEHKEAAAWISRRRHSTDPGPAPAGITKLKELPDLDDHFWDCCERFRMYETEGRWNFVRRLVSTVFREGRRHE
jgi:hypothetical protein